MIKLIPEYRAVDKLYLSFANEFFNTRFGYGEVITRIVKILKNKVDIEIFVNNGDSEYLESELIKLGLSLSDVITNENYYGTSITTTGFPLLGENNLGIKYGLVYKTYDPKIDEFGSYICKKDRLKEINLGFRFNSAAVAINDDLVLVSVDELQEKNKTTGEVLCADYSEKELKLREILDNEVILVPSLPGELTCDLDTFLMPIKPKVWISADYGENSVQNSVIDYVISLLKERKHIVHQIPGLKSVVYDDINTLPNYQNSIIINNIAIVPAYNIVQDLEIQNLLREYNFEVHAINCSKLIESNAALHCISRMKYR